MARRYAVLVALWTASCGSCVEDRASTRDTAASAASAERGLVLGATEEPDTLDPAFTEISGAQEIVHLLFRDLTEFDPSWRVQPSLAAELPRTETSSSGAFRVVWRLKEGLRWSDGAPLTAQDVAFGFRITRDPKLEISGYRPAPEVIRMRARSALELAVDWKQSIAGYDAPRVHAILPKHAYPDPNGSAPAFRGLGRTPVSSGPYRLREWVAGQHLTVEPNPSWTLAKPRLGAITWRFFKSEDALEAELRTGGIDALGEASGLSIERAEGLKERLAATHVVEYTESGLWLQIALRLDHPALKDVGVRRALSLAIDRDEMARLVYGRRATPAFGCFPPRHPAHREQSKRWLRDPIEADRLLDEAGFRRASKDAPIRQRAGGASLELGLQLAAGSQASERAAAYVQSELAKIGVRVTLEALPLRVLFQKMRERSHAPLVLFAWRSSPDWDAAAMLRTGGRQNYGGYSDAETDRLLEVARHARDRTAWADALAIVEDRYREALPSIPLLFRNAVSVRPKALEGWAPTGTTTPVTWNAELWHWSETPGPSK